MAVVLVLSGAAVLVVAVVVVMQLLARTARRRRLDREDELVRTGTETTATITWVPPGHQYIGKGLWIQVTFSFTDLAGAEHSLKRNVLIHRAGELKVGDTTRLWYDPALAGRRSDPVVELEQSSRRGS